MAHLLITGASGAGKSTIGHRLRERGFEVSDTDRGLCNWQERGTGRVVEKNPQVCSAAFLAAHDWVCDTQKLSRLLTRHAGRPFAVVGVSSNQDSILPLFNRVVLLQCSQQSLLDRLASRAGNPFGKNESERQAVLGYHKAFEEQMIRRGAIPLANDGSIERTLGTIMHYLRRPDSGTAPVVA